MAKQQKQLFFSTYAIEFTENSMNNIMSAQERILYICERLTKDTCGTKQLSLEIFGTDEKKKVRLIQNDIKLLKERYPQSIYEPKKGSYKFVSLPDFINKLMDNDTQTVYDLFEFVTLFDAPMTRLFEQSEPLLMKKLKRETKSIYYIKDDPIEEIKKKDIWKILKKAVKERRYISLDYEKNKLKQYTHIKPMKIVFAQNNWYVAALSTQKNEEFEFTFFRLAHMDNVKMEPTTFHEDIEAISYLENIQTLFELYKTEKYTVRLLAKAHIASYFKNKKYLKSQHIEKLNDDGSIVLQYKINNMMEILPTIKKWLPDLIVLEPQQLKDAISKIITDYDT